MIWFTHILVFLAQALVLIHADVCRTLDVINTHTFPYHRHASTHLYGLLCSSTSQDSDYAPYAPEPETWYLSTPEPIVLSLPPPEPVAPIVVLPSPTRTVAPFIASDTCSLSSDYSSYTDGPTALSTEPTGNSGDVDDQDTAAHYRVSQALSKDAFKAKRPQPIHVEVYIGLAVCCISTLLGAFIVVSRTESAHAKETSTVPRRRSTSPYKAETEPDGEHNHSSFVFAQPESQFPFSDMVYEQAIASTLAELAFTTTQDCDGTTHGTINLDMEHNCGSNLGSGRQEEDTFVNPRFDSSDGVQQDRKTSLRGSGLFCIATSTTRTVSNKNAVVTYNKRRMNGSETRSNVVTMSNDESLACTTANDITGATVSTSELTLVALPSQEGELSSKSEFVSFSGLIESSGSSDSSASVSITLNDGMGNFLDKANGVKEFLYAEQADNLEAAALNCSAHAVVPSRGSEEDERIVIPLGLSTSIWAHNTEDLSEQSSESASPESDLTEAASRHGKNASFEVSTFSTLASTQSSPSVGSTSAGAPRKHTGFLRALHAVIKESVEGRQKEAFSLRPSLLRSTVTQDATNGRFPPNQVPPEAIPSPSRCIPRKVGESAHSLSRKSPVGEDAMQEKLTAFTSSSKAMRSRPESLCASGEDNHRNELPTTPEATPLKRASRSSSGGGNTNNESARKNSAQGKCDTSRGSPGDAHDNSQSRQQNLPRYKPGRGPSGMPWIRRPI
ncbi:hypothetical protein ACEPAF_1009 [Sanghuangporus sanghuang]